MENKFKSVLIEALEIEGQDILMSDSFRDYPEWSSLAQLSLIAMLDDEFGVVIEDKVFQSLKTVEELYEEVRKRAEKI